MKQIAIKKVPEGMRGQFPSILVGPPYKVDLADRPDDRHFTFEVQVWWKDGTHHFYIWRIPGQLGQEDDVLQMLRDKAVGLGINCLWIYDVRRPLDPETANQIRRLNIERPWLNYGHETRRSLCMG